MDVEKMMARKAAKKVAAGLINDKFVKALPYSPDKDRVIRDDVLTGFTLRVGKKWKTFSYRSEKRLHGRRQATITKPLGRWEDGVTATKARHDAEKLKIERREGTLENTSARGAKTLATVWPAFIKLPTIKRKREKRPLTKSELTYCYARLSPAITAAPLRDLMMDEGAAMQAEYDRIVEAHGRSAANNTLKVVRQMYRHANKNRKLPSGSPIDEVAIIEPEANRPSLSVKEMPVWWAKVRALKNPWQREALLMTLLTALRKSDVESMRWEHLDIKNRSCQIVEPKGGPERAFALILSREMLRVLIRLRKLNEPYGSPWLFPAKSKSGHIKRLPKDKVGAVNHALRRTYVAVAKNYCGFDEADIGRLLNHAGKGATSTYVRATPMGRAYLAQQEAISRAIVAALHGRPIPEPAL